MEITSIIELRMRIGDPNGYPVITSVTDLPDEPDEQTAYRLASGKYVDHTGSRIELMLGDERIDAWITALGTDSAECRCYTAMAALLGGQCRLVSLSSGAESTEYARVSELYNLYRNLSDECKDRYRATQGNNSGMMGQSLQPVIGGGLL